MTWGPAEMARNGGRGGQLFALGVGPGDPELLTLKALRLLRAAKVIAYPAPEEGESIARRVVAEWLDRGQPEIAIRFPMRPGPPPTEIYRDGVRRLSSVLDAGDDVAYLCQGDPLFYGSFAGILTEIAARHPVTVVPGISSLTACTAAAVLPLVRRDDVLSVIPATLSEEMLTQRLAACDVAVVIKLGRHFVKVRRVLGVLGLLESATYVEHASWPSQRLLPFTAVDPATVPYFATALVRRG
jgi:precorrin-2/cobalt-factor-2 C20-methyltransferase